MGLMHEVTQKRKANDASMLSTSTLKSPVFLYFAITAIKSST